MFVWTRRGLEGLFDEVGRVIDVFFDCIQREGSTGGLWRLAAVLARKETSRFLDKALGGHALGDMRWWELFRDQVEGDGCSNILSGVPAEKLLDWCRGDAEGSRFQGRLLLLSEALLPLEKKGAGDDERFVLSKQARSVVEGCVDPLPVIRNFGSRIQPSGWSGNLSEILLKRGGVFEELLEHARTDVRAAAREQVERIKEAADREKAREEEDRRRMLRFE